MRRNVYSRYKPIKLNQGGGGGAGGMEWRRYTSLSGVNVSARKEVKIEPEDELEKTVSIATAGLFARCHACGSIWLAANSQGEGKSAVDRQARH
jgi:hypothetical protein